MGAVHVKLVIVVVVVAHLVAVVVTVAGQQVVPPRPAPVMRARRNSMKGAR